MVASAVFVVFAGGIPFMQDLWGIEFCEFGPTSDTVVMVPMFVWSLIFLSFESNSLEEPSGVDAPLLVLVHSAPIASLTRFGQKLPRETRSRSFFMQMKHVPGTGCPGPQADVNWLKMSGRLTYKGVRFTSRREDSTHSVPEHIRPVRVVGSMIQTVSTPILR
jgi:hypothetical protein